MQTYASSRDAQHGVQTQSGNLTESAGSDVFNHEQISNQFSEDSLESWAVSSPFKLGFRWGGGNSHTHHRVEKSDTAPHSPRD